jgi:DNA modification methylase
MATGPTHVKDLVPDPENRRTHNPRNLGMVVDALHQVGAARSIVIDEDNVILAGNGVTEAAAEAGITKVRVIEADGHELIAVRRKGLSKEQKRALAIYDNRTAELAEWNAEQLQADLAAGLSLEPWFSEEEQKILLGKVEPKGGLTDPDAVPDQRATDIKLGDLFELGKHRLLCGDSTKAEDVTRLIGDNRACMMFTDPPYGVMFKSKGSSGALSIAGDISQATIPISFAVAMDVALDTDARIYVCGGQDNLGMYLALFDHHLRQIPKLIIWVKEQFVMRPNNYHSQFELVYFGWKGKGGGPSFWSGDRKHSDVWQIKRDARADYEHPTQKPVELPERAIVNSAPLDGIVFEPFSGSGSTLIACERHTRRCAAIEAAPSFVQVAIDRWEQFTGQKAVKVGEAVSA